nr:putative ribonuclease H-like domain-containing protein [Tanacetum cinerariifolium]
RKAQGHDELHVSPSRLAQLEFSCTYSPPTSLVCVRLQVHQKGQFLKELRDNIFSGSDHEDVKDHIEKVLKIVDLFHIPDITQDQVMLRAFPMSLTGAQEPDETLYQAWERFKELLMECPQHYLTDMQEVILFYNGLKVPTRQIIDSKGYGGNGNRNAGRQNRNQAFNARTGNDETNQIVQRVPRTKSTPRKANVQCYNCNEKGHYARDCQKPRVRDAKNNGKLTAAVMLIARIQPADGKTKTVSSYDAKSISEVNASFKVHEKVIHVKCKTIIQTSDDDQIDSNIIFDDSYVENNGGTSKHGYGGNGNRNAGRQNRNQAFNARTGNDETNQIVQRVPRTKSTPRKANVQCYNCNEKGHYARDCQKPRVRDAKNNGKLTAAVMLIARIQPADGKTKTVSSYDAKSISEVNASFKVHEKVIHVKCKTIIQTFDDDQIDSNIIFDDSYVENNGGTSKHGSNAHDEYHEIQLYLEDIVNLEEKLSSHDQIVYKMGQSIQTIHMLGKKPNKVYDPFFKAGLGYKNPERLKKAIAAQPKMYEGEMLHSAKLKIDSPDSEEILEDAEESRLKMRNKMAQINYGKLNALYETFVPQQEFSVEQTYFSIPSTLNNGSESKEVTLYLPILKMPREDVIPMSASLLKNLKEFKEELLEEVHEIQDKYVADISKKFNFSSVNTASTPIGTNKAFLKDEEAKDMDIHLYISMIGSLMYLTASKPDIIYLRGQPKLGLWYPSDSPFDLEAFSNSDYAGASLDRKSTTGGCQFLRKRMISWKCKKQTLIANSTTKAEYVVVANYYRQKPTGSEGFQEIVDFLNGTRIRYTLTKNPTIFVSLIKKFWQTAIVRTVNNGEQEITATIDGKEFTITEAFVRRHL